jgi:hypothetical protein
MKHSYLMTAAVLAIAIPLVLGATGIINPSVAYAQEKRIQINEAEASNYLSQSNHCGNDSLVAVLSAVVCANDATQSNTISQSQSYTEDPSGSTATSTSDPTNNGFEEVNVQKNIASASNSAEQSNDCGNNSKVIFGSVVACANSANQSNEITQSQSITDEG